MTKRKKAQNAQATVYSDQLPPQLDLDAPTQSTDPAAYRKYQARMMEETIDREQMDSEGEAGHPGGDDG